MIRLRAALAASLLALAARAAAGPCVSCAPNAPAGWWDDRAVAPGHRADESPRIDVDGDGVTSRAGIVFERRETGDGDVVLAVSDDGGCSWTEAAVTSGPDDDRVPDVAVLLAKDLVAVTFVRGASVMATISGDGGRTFSAPEDLGPADGGSAPRVAMIATSGEAHVHAAWCEGGRLRFSRSLLSGAAASWSSDPPLSDRLAGVSSWTSVEVSADTRSSVPGTDSAVTLLAAGLATGSAVPEVFALRSNDSGASFLGDPATPATLDVPRRVSPARTSADPARGAGDPCLDVSDDGSGEFWSWEAAGFTDHRAGAEALGDARAEEGTTPTTLADWNDGPADDVVFGSPARAAAVAVIPNPLQRPPSPEAWWFFESEPTTAGTEIFGARAMLDTSIAGWIGPTCAPFRVTGVEPARRSGAVVSGSCAADEDLSHVFLAWADTRDGGSSVSWKRTDTSVAPPFDVAAIAGDCARGGGLLVSWTSPPQCDLRAVRIEWSLAPGSTDGSAIVSPISPAQVTGVPPGAALFVRVVAVDEACNEASSAEASGTAATCGPVRPPNSVGWSLRAARRPTPGDVELRWAPPPPDAAHDAATSYDVYRSVTRAGAGFSAISSAGPEPFVDVAAAAPGAALLHFYLVVARNSAGTSGDEPLP